MNFKRFLLGAWVGLSICTGTGAAGVAFDHVGDSATVVFGTTSDTQQAQFVYTLVNVSGNEATFDIDIRNDSNGPGVNRINSFGVVTIAPDLSGVATGPVSDWNVLVDKKIVDMPVSQAPRLDFCARFANVNGGGSCGVANNGVAEGASSSLNVTMTFAGALDIARVPITFTEFAVRFVVLPDSFDHASFAATSVAFTNFVPEPTSAALVMLALAALGVRRMNRQA